LTNVAIVGATGAVGRTMLSILEERNVLASNVRLMASHRSAGQTLSTRWGDLEVEDLATSDPSGIDIALFSAGADRSLEHAKRFVEGGSVVIDNSSAFRMDPDVPLVVAQVNDEAAGQHKGIIANPNCTTMTLMMAAGPLHEAAGLNSMVVASYQSVSGSGQQGVEELMSQNRRLESALVEMMQGGWIDPKPELYERPIGYNVLPFAGSEVDGGYTDEEMKLVRESRKILDIPDLADMCACAGVSGSWSGDNTSFRKTTELRGSRLDS